MTAAAAVKILQNKMGMANVKPKSGAAAVAAAFRQDKVVSFLLR